MCTYVVPVPHLPVRLQSCILQSRDSHARACTQPAVQARSLHSQNPVVPCERPSVQTRLTVCEVAQVAYRLGDSTTTAAACQDIADLLYCDLGKMQQSAPLHRLQKATAMTVCACVAMSVNMLHPTTAPHPSNRILPCRLPLYLPHCVIVIVNSRTQATSARPACSQYKCACAVWSPTLQPWQRLLLSRRERDSHTWVHTVLGSCLVLRQPRRLAELSQH